MPTPEELRPQITQGDTSPRQSFRDLIEKPQQLVVRIHELPGKSAEGDQKQPGYGDLHERMRPLKGAWRERRPVLQCWERVDRGGEIELIQSGRPFIGEEVRGDDRILSFPPGAKGREVNPGNLDSTLQAFPHWTRIHGIYAPLGLDEDVQKILDPKETQPLESGLLRSFHGAFARLVYAEPVPPDEIQQLSKQAHDEWKAANAQTDRSKRREIEAKGHEARLKELELAQQYGYWRVKILVGARNADDAHSVPGLIADSSHSNQPYTFKPEDQQFSRLDEAIDRDTGSFYCSTPLLATLLDFPEKEIPGVRIFTRPHYDTNVEGSYAIPPDRRLIVGVLFDNYGFPAGEIPVDRQTLTHHEFVSGMTRSGKTENTKNMLKEISKHQIPWLVFDPKGDDYSVMGARLKADGEVPEESSPVRVIRPGALDQPPLGFNPLEPEPGFPIEEHLALLQNVLLNAFGHEPGRDDIEASEVMERFMRDALWGKAEKNFLSVHERNGWDIIRSVSRFPGGEPPHPNLLDLQRTIRDAGESLSYIGEATNIPKFLDSRVGSLMRGAAGEFFNGYSISIPELLSGNTVIELDRIKNPADRSLIMGTTLIRILEYLTVQERQHPESGQKDFNYYIVFEEANELVEEGPVADQITEIIRKIGQKGVGIRLVSQTPSSIHKGALGNTGNKYAMHLESGDDQQVAIGTILDEEQRRHLGTLGKGEMLFHGPHMDNAVFGITPDPRNLPNEKDYVVEPDSLVKKSSETEEIYTREEMVEAKEVIERTREGRLLLGWADLTAISSLLGLGEIKPDDEWCRRSNINIREFDNLRQLDPRKQNCIISLAVNEVVRSRFKRVLIDHPLEDLAQHVTRQIKAHLAEQPLPEDAKTDLTLASARYFKPVATLFEFLARQQGKDLQLIGRHPDSDKWEAMYGHPIPGDTAMEQLEFLHAQNQGIPEILFSPRQSGEFTVDHAIGGNVRDAIAADSSDENRTKRNIAEQARRTVGEIQEEIANTRVRYAQSQNNEEIEQLANRLRETTASVQRAEEQAQFAERQVVREREAWVGRLKSFLDRFDLDDITRAGLEQEYIRPVFQEFEVN